ncbi:lysophospholipid acyltransferase family protein [Sulfurihydrogenibium sp.]|uniref:lysophospholipid acyltransferase family protein n=1 Tax=Sulfurihydrogenibium sp. TaxID=2053621 RepID=UPI002606CD63|nr:lysophospholipid acyltransferase family protein [Sulfurihydrogenibium sp.]
MLDKIINLTFEYFKKLPREKALKKANKIGDILYFIKYRKDVVEKNLSIAFPDKDQKWKDYIRKKSLQNIGRVLVEFPRQPDYVKSGKIKDVVLIEKGQSLLDEIKKTGGIIVSGHISSWEMCGAGISFYLNGLTSLAYRQENEKINKIITQIREQSGIKIIFHDQPLKHFINALKNKEVITFLVDQNALRHRGYFVDFFGLKASTVNFPAKLVAKYNIPILFAYTYFNEEDKRYYINVENIEYKSGKDEEETAFNITQAYTKKIEEAVKKHPDQYLWVHKRWKTRENEELEKIY